MGFGIIKTIISIAELILYFIPFFRVSVVMPEINEFGIAETTRRTYSYGMLKMLSTEGLDLFAVIGIGLAAASAVLCIISLILQGEKIQKVSTVVWIISLAVFIVLLILASIAQPKY